MLLCTLPDLWIFLADGVDACGTLSLVGCWDILLACLFGLVIDNEYLASWR